MKNLLQLFRNIRTARRLGSMPLRVRRDRAGVSVFEFDGEKTYIAVMTEIWNASPTLYRWLLKYRVI